MLQSYAKFGPRRWLTGIDIFMGDDAGLRRQMKPRMGVGQHWHKPVDRDEVKSLEGGTYSGAV